MDPDLDHESEGNIQSYFSFNLPALAILIDQDLFEDKILYPMLELFKDTMQLLDLLKSLPMVRII